MHNFFFHDNNGIARARPRFGRASSEFSLGLPGAILLYRDARWPHAYGVHIM
jgi:hypothetical protein